MNVLNVGDKRRCATRQQSSTGRLLRSPRRASLGPCLLPPNRRRKAHPDGMYLLGRWNPEASACSERVRYLEHPLRSMTVRSSGLEFMR